MSLDNVRADELAKVDMIRDMGINPYPYFFQRTHKIIEVRADFDALMESNTDLALAGRLMTLRRHGKAIFGDVSDEQGTIQIYLNAGVLSEADFKLAGLLTPGDIIGVHGNAFITRTGEQTIKVTKVELLTKCLRPLPDKWHGFKDKQLMQRQRYLHLVVDKEVRDRFRTRAKMLRIIRGLLDSKGYLEVETPILQPIYGGAFARPFVTRYNALDMDMYLRIADELYLKRLIIGGYDGVYEFGKDFRNEGLDHMHNPEFTLLEVYCAYQDYNDMISLTEGIFDAVRRGLDLPEKMTWMEQEVDMSLPWLRRPMLELISEYAHLDVMSASEQELQAAVLAAKETTKESDEVKQDFKNVGRMHLIEEVFESYVQPNLVRPTFVIDFPKIISPLAKEHRTNSRLAERFELFIAGREMANSFSELNDPVDQRKRFEEQMQMRDQGVVEAQVIDEDFLRAMEYGMPPTGGLGIGIDRMAMLFTGTSSIREVLFFPQLRPETP